MRNGYVKRVFITRDETVRPVSDRFERVFYHANDVNVKFRGRIAV